VGGRGGGANSVSMGVFTSVACNRPQHADNDKY